MSEILKDFDKKNEVPKVKIPKFATGGICNDAIFPKLDSFSQIDEIVKDITKKKDNAIAMEFTKCIGELLKKNGVTPKITEYTHENVKEHSIEQLYGVTIDELDFSEHDKVFEDKIELLNRNLNLQKDKRYEAETERNYLAERFNQLKGENADMGVKKGILITIIILLLMFLFCIPIVLEWNVFNELLNGYAKGFLIVVIARKTADWIMGDKKDD